MTRAVQVVFVAAMLGLGGVARADGNVSLAVLPLDAKLDVPPQVTDLLTDNIANEVRATKAFGRVIGPQEVATLMPADQRKMIQQCASDECALVDQELAGALGTTHLLVGNVGRLGHSFLLNLRLLDLRTADVLATVSERVRGESPELLLDVVRPTILKILVDGKMMEPPPVEEPPPAPPPVVTPVRKTPAGPTRAGVVRVISGVGFALAAIPALGALGLWSGVAAATVYDFATGYRLGGRHGLTANQALASNVAFVAALTSSAVALVLGVAFTVAFATSWVAS